jgi:hypothetical protein
MSRSSIILPVVAVMGLALFFCFLTQLLLLRYERGDIYPPCSTLRADPLGARAFFEALQDVSGVKAVRGFGHLSEELRQKPGSLFYLGLDQDEIGTFSEDEVTQLDDYVRNGGRVIITFSPEESEDGSGDTSGKEKKAKSTETQTDSKGKNSAPSAPASNDNSPPGSMTEEEKYERDALRLQKEAAEKDGETNPDPFAYHYAETLTGLWGFGTDASHEKEKINDKPHQDWRAADDETPKAEVLALRSGAQELEATVPWKSALYFVRLEPEWEALYTAKSKPVLIHRTWGKGEIIVASDSYFISNEGVRKDRSPRLLSFLAGPPGLLLFDETHLGTQQQEGVMFLMNKFHLEGMLYALLAVLLLLLWRNSVPLVPPHRAPPRDLLGGAVSGKDSRSGLVNLLRRNVSPKEILPTSLAEWQRTVTPTQPHLNERLSAMTALLAGAETKRPEQIVQLYHQLREINTNRTQPPHATKS